VDTNLRARRGGVAAVTAGALIALALVGPILWNPLWLALAPAAGLLILAVHELHAAWRVDDGRFGAASAAVLEAAAATLLVLMLAGVVAEAVQGLEPAWISAAVTIAGYGFLVAAALFGAGMIKAGIRPRWALVFFAVGLPLGLGLDRVIDALPFGGTLFLAGAGFYLGFGLFALALMRFGFAARAR
jgi:hypothetical protein